MTRSYFLCIFLCILLRLSLVSSDEEQLKKEIEEVRATCFREITALKNYIQGEIMVDVVYERLEAKYKNEILPEAHIEHRRAMEESFEELVGRITNLSAKFKEFGDEVNNLKNVYNRVETLNGAHQGTANKVEEMSNALSGLQKNSNSSLQMTPNEAEGVSGAMSDLQESSNGSIPMIPNNVAEMNNTVTPLGDEELVMAPPSSPQIVERPPDLNVRVGSRATFYCRVSGNPPPQVHWRKNWKKVSPFHSRIAIKNSGGYSMLTINPIRHSRDDGTYECIAGNGVGDPGTASSNLTVFSEDQVPEGFPFITDPPTTEVVEMGKTATLTCKSIGRQPLNIVWLKDQLPFQPNERVNFSGNNGDTLQITHVGEGDSGSYDCIVKNEVGTEFSPQSARIYVKERRTPPEFSVSPDPLYEVALGADLNVTCVAVGSPMPTVRWRKGMDSLAPDDAFPDWKECSAVEKYPGDWSLHLHSLVQNGYSGGDHYCQSAM